MSQEPDRSRWWKWHEDYDDPDSALARRLAVVVSRTRDALAAVHPGPVRLVSACAGQGRDVVAALDEHPRRGDVRGRLLELDPSNVAAARAALGSAGLRSIDVVQADAGVTDAYVGSVPADVLLLCGIFGNISDEDVENTVRRASGLCAAGGFVVWTRHRRDPDLTPAVRAWFAETGWEEIAFDAPPDVSFAVGTNRQISEPESFTPGVRLFSFL
jgi:hypothetical protein